MPGLVKRMVGGAPHATDHFGRPRLGRILTGHRAPIQARRASEWIAAREKIHLLALRACICLFLRS